MKKKILYVITKGNFGGAQRYVFDIAQGLKNDFDVEVASGEPGLLHEKLSEENIPVHIIPSLKRDINIKKDLSSLREIIALLKQTEPDIIHTNSSKAGFTASISANIYNILYSRKKPVKIIFTSHGWGFNEDRSFSFKILLYLLHIMTVLFSHKTITVSERSKKDLSFFPLLKRKMITVHNGTNAVKLLSRKKAREVLGEHNNFKTWIGTLSELHKNKGLDIALKGLAPILKSNNDIGFYIAGRGEEEKSLKKLTKRLGIEKQVIFLGFIKNARTYLNAFDIFLLSSRTECFPYVLMEAGFAKKPVIATGVGGVPEIIENLYSGMLIRSNSPVDVTHSIQYALEHKKELKTFGKNLYSHVKENLSLEKMIQETRNVYSKV